MTGERGERRAERTLGARRSAVGDDRRTRGERHRRRLAEVPTGCGSLADGGPLPWHVLGACGAPVHCVRQFSDMKGRPERFRAPAREPRGPSRLRPKASGRPTERKE